MKILVIVLCLMLCCIPSYSLTEDMNFEGEWLAYIPAWALYNLNEYDTTIEEVCADYLVEITNDQISLESISVNESYSIFFGEIKTKFFQKTYDNLYGDGDESDRITGAKAWWHSNDIVQYELLIGQENEYDYYRKWWCFFRYPGDNGEGIKGKWLISFPGAIYSLNDDGTGMSIGLFDYEITYTYNPEQNTFTIFYSPEEKVQLAVVSPSCLLYEHEENGYTSLMYLMKTSR